MIEEAYCSFEVAKLLEEKGFAAECLHFYTLNGIRHIYDHYHNFDMHDIIECPTHQMAMCWLREVHNLCISIYPAAYRYGFTIDKSNTGSELCDETIISDYGEIKTYEEATEVALKYVLEHLI